jgi:integrase
MRVLFKFAMLWDWLPGQVNPMSLFSIPGSTIRKRNPRIITPAQYLKLMEYFAGNQKLQTMITGGYCLGLGASELFGLKWLDFDHHAMLVTITRGIVDGHVGPTKNQYRNAPIPMHKIVADSFLAWRHISRYKSDGDWVFASEEQMGELPYNSQHIQFNTLAPAGKAIGLDFSLGWHALRHSFKNIIKATGSDPETMRDLMRHSDTHTTMNVYGEPDIELMRGVSNKAMDLIFKNRIA